MKFIQVTQSVSKGCIFVTILSAPKFHKNHISGNIFNFLGWYLDFITGKEPGKQLFDDWLCGMYKYGMNDIGTGIKFHIIHKTDHAAIHYIDNLSAAYIRIFHFYHLFQYMFFRNKCEPQESNSFFNTAMAFFPA